MSSHHGIGLCMELDSMLHLSRYTRHRMILHIHYYRWTSSCSLEQYPWIPSETCHSSSWSLCHTKLQNLAKLNMCYNNITVVCTCLNKVQISFYSLLHFGTEPDHFPFSHVIWFGPSNSALLLGVNVTTVPLSRAPLDNEVVPHSILPGLLQNTGRKYCKVFMHLVCCVTSYILLLNDKLVVFPPTLHFQHITFAGILPM